VQIGFAVHSAILIVIAAKTWLVTAAQWAWNLALSANPIGLIVIGAAALIVVLVLLITHWKQVTEWVQKTWTEHKTLAGVLTFLVQPILGIIGFLGVLLAQFGLVVGAVKELVEWLGKIHVPEIHLPFGIGGPSAAEKAAAAANASVASQGGVSLTGGRNPTDIISFDNAPSHHRAGGGFVVPGRVYTVGERGPETFVPVMAGNIVPHGGGDTFTFHQVMADSWSIANEIAWAKKTRRL